MKIYNQVRRTVAWCLWCAISTFGLAVCFFMFIREGNPQCLLGQIFPAFASLMLVVFLYENPKISLEPQGVRVQWWFQTHFCCWDDFQQAGVSCFVPHGYYINRLVLVSNGCSKRRCDDKSFHLRNFGKLIYISAKPEVIAFVRSCYGPLDFDLTDGKVEQSIVVDE